MAREKKPRGSDAKLARLHAMRNQPAAAETTLELRRYLADASSFVVAEAARIIKDQVIRELAGDLVSAFDRFMIDSEKSDKQCRAKIEIVDALNLHNPKITASIAAAVGANGAESVREWFRKKFPLESESKVKQGTS